MAYPNQTGPNQTGYWPEPTQCGTIHSPHCGATRDFVSGMCSCKYLSRSAAAEAIAQWLINWDSEFGYLDYSRRHTKAYYPWGLHNSGIVVHGPAHSSENQDMMGVWPCLCGRTFNHRDFDAHVKENQATEG